ncbi:MAG: NAD-dependent epimerase/dehydratase family protein [Alphaproteobacteria bacterium]
MKKTYVVTGGCGFIGSHLADALVAAGHGVRILDDLSTGRRENAPSAAEIVVGTVADPATVRTVLDGADGCFHLAAIASVTKTNEDWIGTHRVNLTGAIHVFEAARRARRGAAIPVVYASSAAVYGDCPHMPLSEGAETRPLSAYGADKLGCELHGRVAGTVHGVAAIGLRFFNVFGPRQDPSSPYSGVISIFANRVLEGRELVIFGDGEQVRDFIYVGDVVRCLIAAMDRVGAHPREVYNVCTGRSTSVRRLAETVSSLNGVAPRLRFEPARTGDIRISVGDGTKACRDLGFCAETSFEDGLRTTLAAMRGADAPESAVR